MTTENKKMQIEVIAILLLITVGIIFSIASLKSKNEYSKINYYSEEKDIKKVKGKKNLYFFWGDGCQFCAKEKEYLDKFYKKNHDKYQIYGFEIWHSAENNVLLDKFEQAIEDDSNSIPILIIGDDVVIGFNENVPKEIEEKLKKIDKNYVDIYDKIKE